VIFTAGKHTTAVGTEGDIADACCMALVLLFDFELPRFELGSRVILKDMNELVLVSQRENVSFDWVIAHLLQRVKDVRRSILSKG